MPGNASPGPRGTLWAFPATSRRVSAPAPGCLPPPRVPRNPGASGTASTAALAAGAPTADGGRPRRSGPATIGRRLRAPATSPAVRLLRVPNPGRGPPERLFEEVYRVLQVKPPDVGSPQEVEVRFAFSVPPKPQLLRLAALSGELSYLLHQDYGASHNWRPLAPVALCYASDLGV